MTQNEKRRRCTYETLDAWPVPVHTLQVTGRMEAWPWILDILRAHGVTIEEQEATGGQAEGLLLHLPEGSTKQLLYPFDISERYRIQLPDGAAFLYRHDPTHQTPHIIGEPQESEK